MSSMAFSEHLSTFLNIVRGLDPQFDPGLRNTSEAPMMLSVSGLFSGIAFLVIFVRFYVRIFIVRGLSIDDYFIILASVCASLVIVFLILESKHGLGRYTQFISGLDHAALVKLSYFHFLMLGIGTVAVKISFGLFLVRILQRGRAYVCVKCIVCLLSVLALANVGVRIFRCIPVSAGWSLPQREKAKCLTRKEFMVFIMAINGIDATVDVCFVTLCVFLFYNLQNSRRYRLAFVGMAIFAYLTCFSAIIKTAMTVYALRVNVKFRGTDHGLWSLLELHMALIAASLPKLAPLFKSFLIPPQTRSTSQRTTSTYNSRQPERLRLFPLSKARSRPQRPRRPSTVRTEPSDFDKNPGNRPLACNYKVEVTTLNKYNKSRTSSFGAYRPNTNVDDCEAEDTISCVPAAYMANASSSEEHNGICLATPSSGIIRRTDIYVSMDDALDEDCEDIDDEGTERRRSKWNC